MTSFKYRKRPKGAILVLVRWHYAFRLSYHRVEGLAKERGLQIAHVYDRPLDSAFCP